MFIFMLDGSTWNVEAANLWEVDDDFLICLGKRNKECARFRLAAIAGWAYNNEALSQPKKGYFE